jgi:hypothetical protein
MRRLYRAFLLLTLFAGTTLAQGGGSSVMIHSHGKEGTDAEVVATALANMIQSGMLKQYPCVDALTSDDLRALLGYERWRQLLGQ